LAWFAAAALLLAGGAAAAHALVRSSDPPDGATLDKAPRFVSVTFTEDPDPALSSIHVLDSSGAAVDRGGVKKVSGDPASLRVELRPVGEGSYTIAWRTLSKVDGHVTGGALAFGVGVVPVAPSASARAALPASPLGAAGRWAFDAGLTLLVGVTLVAPFAFAEPRPRLELLGMLGWLAALAGLLALGRSQQMAAAVPAGRLLGTSIGRSLELRGVPLLLAGAQLAVARRRSGKGMPVAGLFVALAILAHVASGHAASGSLPAAKIGVQWIHVLAVGVWIGGLAALLPGIRGLSAIQRATAVRRFSTAAGLAIVVVGLTGALRAVNEVGSLGRLASTTFGRLVLLKVGLFGGLATLGAINRYRNVPRAADSSIPLRRTASFELGIAAVVLAASGLLSSVAPAAYAAQAPAGARPLLVAGNDSATSVRVRMEIDPGFAGPNRFRVKVADYDTGRPVPASRVALRFTYPSNPDVGESTLELAQRGDVWRGSGSNMSLDGRWSIVVVIQTFANSVEVPFTATTRERPHPVTEIRSPGQPTLYTIDLGAGRKLQSYVDPGRAGSNQVHATFFDPSGGELAVDDPVRIVGVDAKGRRLPLPILRLGPGHLAANANLEAGRWTFEITGLADGTSLRGKFSTRIGA
jgi:copper transport protein